MEAALGARDREIDALNDSLAGAQAELAKAVATLELRQQELARLSERILLLDGVATRLAERVVERQRELRAVRAELTERVERVEREDRSRPEPKPATSANGGSSPIRPAGRSSNLPVH